MPQRQAEVVAITDQNGTVQHHSSDKLGREISDAVTLPPGNPENIDDFVLRIDFGDDVCGQLTSVASCADAAGNPRRQG